MCELNEKTIKIQKIGKATRIVGRIFSVATFVGFCLLLIGSFILMAMPGNAFTVNGSSSTQVQVDSEQFAGVWSQLIAIDGFEDELAEDGFRLLLFDTGLSVDAQTDSFRISVRGIAAMLACTGLSLLLTSAFFWFVARLGQTIEHSPSPFVPQTVRGLKQVGFAMLGWTIGSALLTEIAELAVSGNAAALGLNLGGLGYGSILLSLLFLALAYIFQYGVQLQEESDATL